MKTNWKRLISLLLCAVLLVDVLPMRSSAAEIFTDVARTKYYYEPVLWAVNHDPQITNGVDRTHFAPADTCTRGQVVTFLWRAMGKPEPARSTNPFADVLSTQYYYKAVLWAVEKGITNGTSPTTFEPNKGCTRGQVVTFLWRAQGEPTPASMSNPFTDVSGGNFYHKAVLWAVSHTPQITNGTSPTTFSPGNTCTRGQIVTFLYRALKYDPKPFDYEEPDPPYIDEASTGWDGYAGPASIDISGTGTRGDVTIARSSSAAVEDAHTIAVVDASILERDGQPGLLCGAAEIRIPYDKKKAHLNASTLLAGWFNPNTQQWETIPYIVDEENHQVIILTNHLSKFGVFEIEGSGKRTAFAKPLSAAQLAQLKQQTYNAILKPFEDGPVNVRSEDTVGEVLEALDGSFNGWCAFGGQSFNTIYSKGGTIKTGWVGSMGRTCTVIGVVSASLSVANNAYKHGFTSTETLTAMGNAAISLGSTAASAPIQGALVVVSAIQMGYNTYDASKQTSKNKEIQDLFWAWKAEQDWNSWKIKDWANNHLQPMYDRYYTNGAKGTPYENYQDYLDRVKSVINSYAHRFYEAYNSGEVAAMFPDRNVPSIEDTRVRNAVNDVCLDYEQQLGEYFQTYFKAQARACYVDAVNKLESYCETIRQEMNQKITITLQEDVPEGEIPWTQNAKIALGPPRNQMGWAWQENFDEENKATMTFTGTAYMMTGCPDYVELYSTLTSDYLGSIPLEKLDYGDNGVVHFDGSSIEYAPVRLVEEKTGEDYAFAGCKVRIRGQSGPMINENNPGDTNIPERFTINDEGWTTIAVSLKDYQQLEGPTYLDILSPKAKVLKTLPFDIHSQTITLRTTDLTVNVSCADEAAANHYAGTKITLRAFSGEGAKVDLSQTRIAQDGTALMVLPRTDYDFYASSNGTVPFTLYVWELKDGVEVPKERYNLSFDEYGVSSKVLSYDPEETSEEPLSLSRTSVQVHKGQKAPIEVLSGRVGSIRSKDSSIATGSTSAITGHKAGETTISYTDAANPDRVIEVSVRVIGDGGENWGFYRTVPIYEEYISYINGGEGSYVHNMPSLTKNEIPYIYAGFGGWSVHTIYRGIHQGSDVAVALLDRNLSSDVEHTFINPDQTPGGIMYAYNSDTKEYSTEYWAETNGWVSTEDQLLPYTFTVTQHTIAYLNGASAPVAQVTRITRYELTGYRSWGAVAQALSESGWTTD